MHGAFEAIRGVGEGKNDSVGETGSQSTLDTANINWYFSTKHSFPGVFSDLKKSVFDNNSIIEKVIWTI